MSESVFSQPLVTLALQGTGSFFPQSFKRFAFAEGDVIALPPKSSDNPSFSVVRCLKVEEVALKQGERIHIAGKDFVLPEDDSLLVCGVALGGDHFRTSDEAKGVANRAAWHPIVGHTPMRPDFANGGTWLNNFAVQPDELVGYETWRKAFNEGKAGIY